jgi:hypothetical protein
MAPPEGGFRKEHAVRLSDRFRCLALCVLTLLVTGCAGVAYRERSTLVHTRYATVENFGEEEITAEQIDGLLEEVAEILQVGLRPGVPKVRIQVTTPVQIGSLYRQVVKVAPHGSIARALYVPGANLILIPHYQRSVLGHELAHYLTDHYLKSTPRSQWERVAYMVEDALPAAPRTLARRAPVPEVSNTQAAVVPVVVPAN